MKNFSNTYIFLYSAGMVIIVAAALSFAAVQLKPMQQKNIANKKMQNILSSVNIDCDATNADELYKKYITDSYVVNSSGEKVDGDAFKIDIKKELSKSANEKKLPVFVCNKDGKTNYIVPVRGKGLGGAIWGFIAFRDDFNTIEGTTFDHDAETPGLGAKITLKDFQMRFQNKKIFDSSNKFVSVAVLKGNLSVTSEHIVDAISGGTITSNGVNEMLRDCLVNYETYFKNKGQ